MTLPELPLREVSSARRLIPLGTLRSTPSALGPDLYRSILSPSLLRNAGPVGTLSGNPTMEPDLEGGGLAGLVFEAYCRVSALQCMMCVYAHTLSRLRLSGGLLPRDQGSAGLLREIMSLVDGRALNGRAKEGLGDRNVSKHCIR